MENQVTEVKEKKKRNKSKIAIIVLSVVVALFVLGSGVAGYFVIANNYGFSDFLHVGKCEERVNGRYIYIHLQ